MTLLCIMDEDSTNWPKVIHCNSPGQRPGLDDYPNNCCLKGNNNTPMASPITLTVCCLAGLPIWEQLAIEESYLRKRTENVCLINEGSPPAIVMGISGQAEEHVHLGAAQEAACPVLRRFSGGGTVIVDESTLFVTFIFQKTSIDLGSSPERIMQWTGGIYSQVFDAIPFAIHENDYVVYNRKFGGNAQYVTKTCWLHHTSFLWDYKPERMSLLKLPPKMPVYRQERPHDTFLQPLKEYYPSMGVIKERLLQVLTGQFDVCMRGVNV